MAAGQGLRELKKARTRRAIADAALTRFARDGFDETSVQQICGDAEVAVSTFYGYFPSKEATAFLDDDERAELVAAALGAAPVGQPPHVLLRTASIALARHDLANRANFLRWSSVIAREPSLVAYAARRQAENSERFALLLAERLRLHPDRDLRPRLAVAMTFGAVNAAWAVWLADDRADLVDLVNRAHDALDDGLAGTF